MKKTILTVIVLLPMCVSAGECVKAEMQHLNTDVYDGWRLGTQAWTFNRFTLYEAIDKTASLGLDWIEAYPHGQKLSKDKPNIIFGHKMPVEFKKEVKQKLSEAGLKLVNYGVVDLPNDEAECRKVFEFAKEMGIETLVSEPPAEAFGMLDRLCEEYEINVAIHNHPKPSHYWDPDMVLEVCKGRSKRIGACADTGHWARSGINPVEALKKLEGRIISLHLKDINEFGKRKAHDVIWGTGVCDVKAILKELDRQNFEGVFSIEYEHNWEKSLPEIRKSVEYFNKVASKLKPTGWRDLFENDLSNCIYKPGSWIMKDGVLARKGKGNIWTKETFGDFILDLEFKVDKGSNSGVFIRTGNIADFVQTGIEVQIHDTTDGTARGSCGAIYDCLAPCKSMARKAGEWNHYTITCKANKIHVVFNGERIIDMDLNLWTEAHKNPDGTKNKFRTACKDMPRVGHIGLQDHGDPVWFRNIKIKPL
ncbi:MAG: family 16 glycoside hydrolase [Planctomycetota bacterium]|jgi:sugar phosphate isomerase/epimerase